MSCQHIMLIRLPVRQKVMNKQSKEEKENKQQVNGVKMKDVMKNIYGIVFLFYA